MVVERRALWRRLDMGMERALTLVCAPAGYGKTTLLRQWSKRQPTAWVTIEDSGASDDIVREAAAGLSALSPHIDWMGDRPAPDALAYVLNQAAKTAEDFALVIDSSLPSGQPIADVLIPVLDYLPRQIHIFVASRSVLDIPLGRLRMKRQAAELSGLDLALTQDEVGEMLGESPQGETAGKLYQRTEGWSMGLRLLLDGDEPGVARYLEREVMAAQPELVRRFLSETCRLDILTAADCDAVTGRRDGRQMLAALEHGNAFIIPLDSERTAYRYQRMFAEFLRSRS